MPLFHTSIDLPRPVPEIFAFFSRPANMIALAPPELHAQLLEAPELISPGARIRWSLRRLGITQTIVTEVTEFVEDARVVEEQRQGPLARCVQHHVFEPVGEGTRVTDTVDFQRPGGLLGLAVTDAMLLRDFEELFRHRAQRLHAIFG